MEAITYSCHTLNLVKGATGNKVTLRATLYHNGYLRQRSAWNSVCLGVTGTLFVEVVVHFCQDASYANVSRIIVFSHLLCASVCYDGHIVLLATRVHFHDICPKLCCALFHCDYVVSSLWLLWFIHPFPTIKPRGTYFNKMLFEIQKFSFTKMRLKTLSVKWQPLGLNVLMMG